MVVGKRAYKNHDLFKDHYFLSGTLPRSFSPPPSPIITVEMMRSVDFAVCYSFHYNLNRRII